MKRADVDLNYIDYVSVSGRSRLHRVPAEPKALLLLILVTVLLGTSSWRLPAVAIITLIAVAVSARLPFRLLLGLMLYPVLFTVIFLLSVSGLTLPVLAVVLLRVLSITTAVIVFFLSTSFPAVFAALGRVLPAALVTALFFTYRSIFLISDGFTDTGTALHLRGGIDLRRPLFSLSRLGMALGHFLAHIIDASRRMADNLRIRGFNNRIYYLGRRYER